MSPQEQPPPFPAGEGGGTFPAHPCCSLGCELTTGPTTFTTSCPPASQLFFSAHNCVSSLVRRTRPRSGSMAEVTLLGAGGDERCQAEPGHAGPHSSVLQVPARDPNPPGHQSPSSGLGSSSWPWCSPSPAWWPSVSWVQLLIFLPLLSMVTAQQTQPQLFADPPVPAPSPSRSWSCALSPLSLQ